MRILATFPSDRPRGRARGRARGDSRPVVVTVAHRSVGGTDPFQEETMKSCPVGEVTVNTILTQKDDEEVDK